MADRLSILWTEEKRLVLGSIKLKNGRKCFDLKSRFVFGNGEELPPTAFIWEEEEVQLTNSLMEQMTPEERGEE